MSKLKISQDLFLEKEELNRMQRFIYDEGFKQDLQLNTETYGLTRGCRLLNGNLIAPQDVFSVKDAGSGNISINVGRAVNKFAQIISKDVGTLMGIPNTGQWYWVKIKYQVSNEEVGTVSIDQQGNLTGTSTLFTEVLRGQPNFPAKIKFTNSTLGNTSEYEVLDVISDTSAVLSGVFNNESNLKYAVVGTFTHGYVPPPNDKLIFDYDNALITLVLEVTPNTPPVKLFQEEFYLARVQINGINTIVEDKRTEFWQTKADFYVRDVITPQNKVIAIEAEKFDSDQATKDRNWVYIQWAFWSNNFIIDTNTNKVTIQGGNGGRFKDPSYFSNGDFDGLRIYTDNGKYSMIASSTKSGNNINLILDFLNPDDFAASSILVTPNAEEIEFDIHVETPWETPRTQAKFPINMREGKVSLLVYRINPQNSYRFFYRYRTMNTYTQYGDFLNDSVGYYNANMWDVYGNLKPTAFRIPYPSAAPGKYLILVQHPDAYINIVNKVVTGDLLGIEYKTITNAQPQMNLYVNSSRQYQMIFGAGTLTLSTDIFIILNNTWNDLTTPLKNGNNFLIQLRQKIAPGTFNVRIVTNFVNVTSYNLLKLLTPEDYKFLNDSEQGLRFRCTTDGVGNWIIDNVNESKFVYKNYRKRLLASPNTSPATGTSMTYTSFMQFTSDARIFEPYISASCYVLTSNGGPSPITNPGNNAYYYIGCAIRINGVIVEQYFHNLTPSYFYGNNRTLYKVFEFAIPPTIQKGDVVEILFGGSNSVGLTSMFTFSKVTAQINGEATF